MTYRKKHLHKDFKYFAVKGDRVMEDILREWFHKYNIKRTYNHFLTQIVSNEVIVNFYVPCRFNKIIYTNLGVRGDKVEAYIYFLYINYGRESVERYLIRQLKHLLTLEEFN